MSGSRRLLAMGAIAALLVVVGVSVALATQGRSQPGSVSGGYGAGYGMMGGGYGMMGGGYGMMGGGYGMMGGSYSSSGTLGAGTVNRPGPASTHGSQAVTLTVKSDAEHGKLASDGNWHDAFLPADFTVHPGKTVTLTVYNYDDMPHSFSSSLGVDETIPAGSASAPTKTTFTFTAPSKPGSYQWWCALPCDPWAMAHEGYMRGNVTVRA